MAGTIPASAAGGDLFSQLDTDGSGTISRAEFERALGSMTGQTVPAGQVGGACSSGSLAVFAAPAAPASASVILPVYGAAPASTAFAQMTSVAPMGTSSSLTAGGGPRHDVQYEAAEFEPEYIERVVEVPRVRVDHVEKIVEVPEVQMVDRIVEIPMVQDVLEMNDDSYARYGGGGGGACGGGCGGGVPYDFGRRPYDLGSSTGKYPYWGDEGQGGAGAGGGAGGGCSGMYGGKGKGKGGRGRGNLPVKLITREVPKVEVRQVERVVEVPNIEYADRLVEVKEIREVVRRVPRVEVREIPIERIIQVPKKIIQEIERPVYRPVPHLVKQQVEKEIPIPKHYIQTVEVVKQVAVPTTESGDVIPYNSLVDSSPAPTGGAIVHPSVVTSQYTLPAQVASAGQVQTVPASLPSMQFPGASAGPVGSVSCAAGGDFFSQIDKDGSGTISRAEFEQVLGSMRNQSMFAGSIAPQSMQSVSGFPQAYPPSAQSMVGTAPAMQSMQMGQQASMIPGSPTPPMPPPGSAVMMSQSPPAGTLITPQNGVQASQLFGGQQSVPSMVSGQQMVQTVIPGSMQAAQSPPGTRTGYMTPPTPPLGSRTVLTAAPGSMATGSMFPGSMAAGNVPCGSMAGGAQVFAMTPGAGMPGTYGSVQMPASTPQSGIVQGTMFMPGQTQQASGSSQFAQMSMQPTASRANPFGSGCMGSAQNFPPGSMGPGSAMASGMYQTYAGAATPPMAPGSAIAASDLFTMLDKDGSGTISRAEMEQGLAAMRSGVVAS